MSYEGLTSTSEFLRNSVTIKSCSHRFLIQPSFVKALLPKINIPILLAAGALDSNLYYLLVNSYSRHVAPRHVCTRSFYKALIRGSCQSQQCSEWQLLWLASAATKFKLQEPLLLHGTLAARVSAHKAAETMWRHCVGHRVEQESDRVRQAVSSLDQRCFLSSVSLLRTRLCSKWTAELQVLRREH